MSKRVLFIFVYREFIFNQSFFMFLIKLYINYLYSMLTDLYGSYSFQVTRESKWGQHSKFISFISGTILIVLFSLESVLNFLPAFLSTRFDLGPSSYGFREKNRLKGAKTEQHPNDNFFLTLSRICMNSFEKFLSEAWQQICCSFYCISKIFEMPKESCFN